MAELFNYYIDQEVGWINGYKIAAKRAGVLVKKKIILFMFSFSFSFSFSFII